ncbi:MAG: helix-turn-helix domain-containing protein [Acidobacteria bacterium]|nr:helix-turn-helix domain-containing protein [Acidobacteriota bacterium]MCA1650793.1 helix-turn-helix domain-containing protein [Acidobacteriota bacterium]
MATDTTDRPVTVTPLLYRCSEAAIALGVSQSQIEIWRREGLLHAVRLPGIRAIRFARWEVEALAAAWSEAAGASAPQEDAQ